MQGLLLRSKAEWIEGSENNNRFCANVKKKKEEGKTNQNIIS